MTDAVTGVPDSPRRGGLDGEGGGVVMRRPPGLQYEMPGCVCWGYENVPIMTDALGQKHIHIEGILCIVHTHIMV